MRALIGDRFGKLIAEVVADVDSLSWILNGIGKSGIALSISDSKTTAENLQIGNRIYLEFENGLPAWGGVLDLPRDWQGGTVSMTAYTIEWLLKTRKTKKTDAFYEQPAGIVFRDLLVQAENEDPLGITIGSIWKGGRPHWPRYHYKSLWYVLDYSLPRMEQCDFTFTPYIANGHIKFRADFYQAAGDDKSQSVELIEGRNIGAGVRLREHGEIINSYHAVGEGSTWGPERSVIAAKDRESIATYGLRQVGKVHPGVSQPATLEMHARRAIDQHSTPRKLFTLPVLSREPATFASYGLGDTIGCTLPSYYFDGFAGPVRVLGREYDPVSGDCELAVEEPRTIEQWVYDEDIEEESE